ncbi:MAG: hypothetical protein E4G91_12135 [Candidatus Zixiibacteriota bacterium]|nr:MAG: hypothetical protein E4G91_12135 [candidate division Zixibacteria bacterium]
MTGISCANQLKGPHRRSEGMIVPQAQTDEVLELESFGTGLNVAVIGATGGIGRTYADRFRTCRCVETLRTILLQIGSKPNCNMVWLRDPATSSCKKADLIQKRTRFCLYVRKPGPIKSITYPAGSNHLATNRSRTEKTVSNRLGSLLPAERKFMALCKSFAF